MVNIKQQQIAVKNKQKERPLTTGEIALAKQVFKTSIDYTRWIIGYAQFVQ